FFYASNSDASITVYDGIGATGTVLATLSLTANFVTACGYCQWDPIGVSFAGVAKSIDFGGGANFVAYDDITFGKSTPGGGTVPEPATWALMIGGFGMIGISARRRRSAQVSA
ncbi:MAG: PEPxxWA-CTERM sorting domain-containing protein, partial [Janthinobacterium lividum]